MKYKVGDRVRVRNDLKVGNFYNNTYMNDSMGEMKGKIATIREICGQKYILKELEHIYYWDESMLESIIKLTKKELLDMPIGTKIKVKENDYTFHIFIKIEDGYFVNIKDSDDILEDDDIEDDLSFDCWYYEKIIEVQAPTYSTAYIENEEDKKEMTIAEIEEKLGYPIKIVKEKTNE